MADEDEVDNSKNDGNETNLSNLSASKVSIKAGYPTFAGAKKGGNNTKKVVKAAKSPDYLTAAAKKLLTTYGTCLYKYLFFNTLIRNITFELKPTHQAMLLVES